MYRTITADPPWNEQGGGGRGAQNHYPLIKNRSDIHHAMTTARFADGAPAWRPDPAQCHLWLWVTNNFLVDGIWLMGALGFRYVTNAVWVKTRIGLGYYLRGQHELCLFGTMGDAHTGSRSIPTVIGGRPVAHPTDSNGRRIHSRKPEEARTMFEAVSQYPRMEMFARTDVNGWDTWGNETSAALDLDLFGRSGAS